jgi:hypothetical protein
MPSKGSYGGFDTCVDASRNCVASTIRQINRTPRALVPRGWYLYGDTSTGEGTAQRWTCDEENRSLRLNRFDRTLFREVISSQPGHEYSAPSVELCFADRR